MFGPMWPDCEATMTTVTIEVADPDSKLVPSRRFDFADGLKSRLAE